MRVTTTVGLTTAQIGMDDMMMMQQTSQVDSRADLANATTSTMVGVHAGAMAERELES